MNFFDYIRNDSFFKPLTLKYKRIYYECIQLLIDRMKELPVLYETDARDSITMLLKDKNLQPDIQVEGEDTLFPEEENEVVLQAGSIIGLFRQCGWLLPREIGRNGEYVINISTDCRRFMDFLRKMTERTGEGTMSNRIFSMYEIMKSVFEEESVRRERPYSNILVPLIDNETELKNELTDLKDSIAHIMKAVVTFQDINSFGQFIMKDEMLDRFFSEYFFVKNNGLIPTQISYIKNHLRAIRQDELYEKMAVECAEKLQIPLEEAEEKIERDFAELQYFLSVEYEDNMELIDKRINNYYNLANTRIMLMASNGVRLESVINDFLYALSRMDEEGQEAAMGKVAECTRIINQRYVGYRSFEKKLRVQNKGENIGLFTEELSEDEKRERTEELFKSAQNRYSVERVGEFLDVRLKGAQELHMNEQEVTTKEEALMYVAAMLYANNQEFAYEVKLSEETVLTDIAEISNATIAKRKG